MSTINLISRFGPAASRAVNLVASPACSSQICVSPAGNYSLRKMSQLVQPVLTMDNLNPNVPQIQYAVRGPVVARAMEIEEALERGEKFPFTRVIKANIGDGHAMGMQPISFIRQVIACVTYPQLIDTCDFPSDVKQRAQDILKACGGGSVGAYTVSHGIEKIRRDVAAYIEQRDGHPADWQNICLSAGASTAIKNVLQLFCNQVDGKTSGIMIPIPQYPLYSASLAEYGLGQVGYYLDEDNNWALDTCELQRAFDEGNQQYAVRAIVVINPGNPTGQVLTQKNIEDVIKFAYKNKLFIFADEVYQANVYDPNSKFFSFKKIMREMGAPYSGLELASFMSVSKGYVGECGLRGGWMELLNMQRDVQHNLFKAISAMLCPSSVGQVAVDCVARPPAEGEPSYLCWSEQRAAVLQSLAQRARMVVDTFNGMQGFTCNPVQGAMYAFPRIELPPRAFEAAKKEGLAPDAFYAFQLLEATGICVVPGSGFGQRAGTQHFRTTILPHTDLLQDMLNSFRTFHQDFTAKYS